MAKRKSIRNTKETVGGFDFNNRIDPKVVEMVRNGFQDAIFGGNESAFGGPVNSINTLWQNNRWYLISNIRNLLAESYVEQGIIHTICKVPVDDAFRGGIDIHTKELDPGDIEELMMWMEECNDLGIIAQTCIWNRLFGGAGTVLNVDQDPEKELDLKKITRFEMYAADLWELFWNKQNTDECDLALDTGYKLNEVEYYQFYGHKLHKSKVLKQKGLEAPSLVRPRMRGWGTSVVEILLNSLNQYIKSKKLLFEILDEFKVDHYKIKNLASSLLQPQGEMNIRKRIGMVNRQKNYMNAVTMDSEDDWMQKQLQFAGLHEAGQEIRMQVASDMRMPMSKIFGISSQGFSSGQDDIENYNGMIESEIRQKTKFEIMKVVKIRCQLKFGFVPKDLKINFKPLRILSAEQEENVKTQQFTRALSMRTAGELTSKELREVVNKGQLLPIQVETDDSLLNQLKKEQKEKEVSANAPAAPKSTTAAPEAKV